MDVAMVKCYCFGCHQQKEVPVLSKKLGVTDRLSGAPAGSTEPRQGSEPFTKLSLSLFF